MVVKLGRRFSPKNVAFLAFFLFIVILFYLNNFQNANQDGTRTRWLSSIKKTRNAIKENEELTPVPISSKPVSQPHGDIGSCPSWKPSNATIDTFEVFQHFEFAVW